MRHLSKSYVLTVFCGSLVIFGQLQLALSQLPKAKGGWSYKDGKPDVVSFDYGTELMAEDLRQLSAFDSITELYFGFAGIDSEYVTINGDLSKLGRLKNLKVVYLNKDGIVDDDLKFISQLPKIQELELNVKNGEGGCTDRCADYLSKGKTIRELRIWNGRFSDKFIDKITRGMPNLEELMLTSPDLTDESLRLIAERCKKLKVLDIGSDHFTTDGLKHLDNLKQLEQRTVSTPSFWWANSAARWLRRAEEACEKIEDSNAADLTFARLQAVYIEWGEIENAERIALRIEDPFRQVKAHIENARYYAKTENAKTKNAKTENAKTENAKTGNVEQCKNALSLARPLASKSRVSSNALVEAYLELAKSPSLAISFPGPQGDEAYARKRLCQALARHGYLDQALKIAGSEEGDKQQNSLRITIAFAAARAGRIEDTEKTIKDLEMSYSARQNLWGELAAALYKKRDLQAARHYASRVSSGDIRRSNESLLRLASNLPPGTLSINSHAYPPNEIQPLTIPLPSDDPVATKRILEEVIARAERNPVKSTQGQFGPWNQKFQLARIRVQYSLVAALYRKAGNQKEARHNVQLAKEAFQILAEEEKGMATIFALNELQFPLIHFKDVEGLRQLTEESNIPLMFWAADSVVPELLRSGDLEAARELAHTTLSKERGFDRSTGELSEIASCFVGAGKLDIVHEILNGSKPHDFTAAACESAGRAMVKKDRGLLTQPKWGNGIGAFQSAHLRIGAALMAKEMSSAK